MEDKTNYKDRLAGFKNRVTTEPSNTQIQKVVPVNVDTTEKEEIQLGVFISKDLMRKLKMKAASEDATVKEIVNKILMDNV